MAGHTVEEMRYYDCAWNSSAYGFYINKDVKRAELWLRRHDGIEEKKKVRNEFKQIKIEERIVSEAPILANIF